MSYTMYDISYGLVMILEDDAEFKQYCIDTIGSEFYYYPHIDMANMESIQMPYLSCVAYNKKDAEQQDVEVMTQMLVGMERVEVEVDGRIYTERTQQLLELVTNKALEIINKEVSFFGIVGEKFTREYLNIYAAPPMGEEDIQLQVDMILNKKKCL